MATLHANATNPITFAKVRMINHNKADFAFNNYSFGGVLLPRGSEIDSMIRHCEK